MKTENRRWWALSAIVLSVLVVGLDATVLNLALPTLSADLGASTSQLQWMVAGYTVVFGALQLPAGLLGDRYGRKRLMMGGLAFFGLASLLAAEAGSPGELIAARLIMGIGAAVIMPLSLSVLPSIFSPEERSRAVAITSGAMGLALPLGPILGGYLLEHFWWGSVFLINVPVSAIALVATVLFLPESKAAERPRLDVPGAVLSATGLAVLIYGVIEVSDRGWGDVRVLSLISAGAIILAAFGWWQRRATSPMMDLSLFRNRTFLWGVVAATTGGLAMTGALFVVPTYLQVVLGNDTLGSGVRLVPMMLGLMVGAVASDPLTKRIGIKPMVLAGLAVFAAGFTAGAFTGTGTGYGYVAGWLTVIGIGTGLTIVPATDVVLGTLPAHQTGVGSGLIQTLDQAGGAFGAAALGSVLASVYTAHLGPHAPAQARESVAAAAQLHDPALLRTAHSAYITAMDSVLGWSAATLVAIAVLVAVFMPRRAAEPAADTAEFKDDNVLV